MEEVSTSSFFFFFQLRRKGNRLRKQLLNYCQNTVGGTVASAGNINAAFTKVRVLTSLPLVVTNKGMVRNSVE